MSHIAYKSVISLLGQSWWTSKYSPVPRPWQRFSVILSYTVHLGCTENINKSTGFIRGILRGVRYAKSLRVLFLHRRSPSWTTLVLYSRAVFIFNEPTKDLQLPQLIIIFAKMRYCIVKEWMVCYLNFLHFTHICSLYSLWGRKSFHLATVKLCTSCSQTADRKAWSIKSEMKFLFCWG